MHVVIKYISHFVHKKDRHTKLLFQKYLKISSLSRLANFAHNDFNICEFLASNNFRAQISTAASYVEPCSILTHHIT